MASISHNIILNIEKKIKENISKFSEIGLKYGLAGVSLFYLNLGRYYSNDRYNKKGIKILENIFEKINDGYMSANMYKEITEIMWFLVYCVDNNFISEDYLSINNDVSDILKKEFIKDSNKNNFDPVVGFLSYAYYFLEIEKYNQEYKNLLINTFNSILESSISVKKDEVYWKSKLKKEDKIYLGISHGISNIILFLIKFYEKNIYNDKAKIRQLICKSCKYIRSNELEGNLVFPIIIGEKQKEIISKNYCYGDPGTFYGLYQGYNFLNDYEGIDYCRRKFSKIERLGYDKPYLQGGGGITYGIAGLSMLYRNLYKLDPYFSDSYMNQKNKLISLYDPIDKFLGYKGYWNQSVKCINYSFGEGLIGVALELMKSENDNINFENFFYL